MAAPPVSDPIVTRREQMFPRLDPGQLARVARLRRPSRAGEILFEQGDVVDTMYIVVSGEVEVVQPGLRLTAIGDPVHRIRRGRPHAAPPRRHPGR